MRKIFVEIQTFPWKDCFLHKLTIRSEDKVTCNAGVLRLTRAHGWQTSTTSSVFHISTLLSNCLSDLINAVRLAPNLLSYAHWCWLQTECTVISTMITGESNKQRMCGYSYAYICKGTAALTHTLHKRKVQTQTDFWVINKDYTFIIDTVDFDSSGFRTTAFSSA